VDEHDVIRICGETAQRAGDGVLPMLSAFDQLQALLEDFGILLFDLRPKAGDLILAQGDDKFVDSGHSGKPAQRAHKNRHTAKILELLAGRFFLVLAGERGAMRVPNPAAGTMTNTFIGDDPYSTALAERCGAPQASFVWFRVLVRGAVNGKRRDLFSGSGAGLLGLDDCTTTGAGVGTFESCRFTARSSHLPKIILPAVVCSTEVTEMSMVLPIILRALSTTTMVPSSR